MEAVHGRGLHAPGMSTMLLGAAALLVVPLLLGFLSSAEGKRTD